MKGGRNRGRRSSSSGAGTPVVKAAGRVLDQRLAPVEKYLPLADEQAAQDIEHVHRLRVSTRRADAALRLFRPFIDRKLYRKTRRRMKRIRRAAGDARQCDVHLLVLAEKRDASEGATADVLEDLIAWTRKERARAQLRIADAAERDPAKMLRRRRRRLVDSLHRPDVAAILPESDPPVKRAPRTFGDLCTAMLPKLKASLREAAAADMNRKENLHRLRLRGKRLRYALEIFAPCLDGSTGRADQLMRRLQDRLGEINDVVEIIARITAYEAERQERSLAIIWPEGDDGLAVPAWRFATETLLKDYRSQLDGLVASFLEQWDAGEWRELFDLDAPGPQDAPQPGVGVSG